ncbi:hypothetical protein EFV37_22130 [Mesorhizobium loti]|uniref:Uncharacterized protein n=2 Tax=Mesorhizobium jarvisii TaxID=1777867 RepID=A0A6M7TLA2_9HYPH|nr:hypothetical protein A9K72_25540 [Mesorhizobium loti]QKC64683.1 hypothetical protein EB229_22125 [Mesorhizobium jarvisii]QKD10597.1 hypothetical protein EFV37_22130 [Mesorhizobium loti]RJT30587.1 hypothetical protein D3242_24760 [Mesorhizobium jarvisii]
MMAIDQLLAGTPTWEGLNQAFFPSKTADNFDPGDDMKQVLFHFYNTQEGRRIIEWMADLTVRAPFPHVGNLMEGAALAAAKHEARTAVGYALLRAIAEGEQLWTQQRSQTHEASS